jgi:hypothetical protein
MPKPMSAVVADRRSGFWPKFVCLLAAIGLTFSLLIIFNSQAQAVENPRAGSIGVEGTIPTAPPTRAATITTPVNGQTFTSTPITVNGLCPNGLLVKVFSNNIFVGAVQCQSGSYSIQISLFSGQNDIIARVYDELDQAGPDSNQVTVTFNDAQFSQFGTRVLLTSNYAKRGANPGETLRWPVLLSGGRAPYALSVDWGDGKATDLKSIPFADTINLEHIYDEAGIYKVIVKVTDSNGTTAFLQLVGVGNGEASTNNATGSPALTVTKTQILWWPLLIMLPLLLVAFWLGRRHELFSLRKRLEQSRQDLDT